MSRYYLSFPHLNADGKLARIVKPFDRRSSAAKLRFTFLRFTNIPVHSPFTP